MRPTRAPRARARVHHAVVPSRGAATASSSCATSPRARSPRAPSPRAGLGAALCAALLGCGDASGDAISEADASTASTAGTSGSSGAVATSATTSATTGAGPSATSGGSGSATSGDAETTGAETSGDGLELPPLETLQSGVFATSPVCAECHSVDADATALRDELGADISPAELWSGTMMANSARDPFWWAMVTAETLTIPSAAAAIEATCTRCHAPMAAVDAAKAGEPAPDLALLRQQGDGPAHARAQLGLDGVSCALCHQIAPEGLGQESSYSGGFVVGDDMQIFAGHEQPFTMPMMMHTGYTPVAAAHTGTSATCASCHTLVTQPMTPEGEALPGLHTEQAPYLEWRNSVFNTERDAPDPAARDCQGCHMPSRSEQGVPITTRIARRPGGGDFPPVEPRAPFHRHALVGGNTLVPAILRDNRARLNPPASDAALEATIERARDLLANETGSVAIAAPTRDGDALEFAVTLTNLGGHKLPTGYPSRRVWLQVTVRDGADELVFRSGGVDGEGRLVDAAGEVLAAELAGGPVLPHAALIDVDDAPQVYEAVMLDEQGTPTFRLLRADGYAKDNRLLPLGWSAGAPDVDRIAPVGVAGDADFTGGADTTRYRVHAPAADGPYTIEVRALHQVISARFAAELFAVASAPGSPIHAFQDMYEGADRAPTLIASDARVVD